MRQVFSLNLTNVDHNLSNFGLPASYFMLKLKNKTTGLKPSGINKEKVQMAYVFIVKYTQSSLYSPGIFGMCTHKYIYVIDTKLEKKKFSKSFPIFPFSILLLYYFIYFFFLIFISYVPFHFIIYFLAFLEGRNLTLRGSSLTSHKSHSSEVH